MIKFNNFKFRLDFPNYNSNFSGKMAKTQTNTSKLGAAVLFVCICAT